MGADFMPTMNSGKPFKFWCQKVLPLVYDDSLSYYELLSRVIAYLNNTMENVSELGEAYEQLEDFLNHYLDSHNIEQAVNDRLDEMVEDGTLDDIISQVLNDKFNAYTTATNARISAVETTVRNQGTSLNNQSSRITAIENTMASSMVTLPHLYASVINAPEAFNKESLTAWLRYVTSHYGTQLGSRPFMGKYTAYITILIIGFAYHFDTLVNGLPDFSEFIILAWGGTHLYTFGTNNGEVYFKATNALTPITETSTLNSSSGTRMEQLTIDSVALAKQQKLQNQLTKMDEASSLADMLKPSVQKPVVNGNTEKTEETEQTDVTEQTEISEQTEEPDVTEQTEVTEQPDATEQTEVTEEPEVTEQAEEPDATEQNAEAENDTIQTTDEPTL